MNKYDIKELIELLPYNLREEINGYVSSIENAGEEIFKETQVEFNKELLNKLIFISGLRKIWAFVNTQYWAIDNSLSLIRGQKIKEVMIGTTCYGYGSDAYLEIRKLRDNFQSLLDKLGLLEIMESKTIKDILILLKSKSYE